MFLFIIDRASLEVDAWIKVYKSLEGQRPDAGSACCSLVSPFFFSLPIDTFCIVIRMRTLHLFLWGRRRFRLLDICSHSLINSADCYCYTFYSLCSSRALFKGFQNLNFAPFSRKQKRRKCVRGVGGQLKHWERTAADRQWADYSKERESNEFFGCFIIIIVSGISGGALQGPDGGQGAEHLAQSSCDWWAGILEQQITWNSRADDTPKRCTR